MALWGPMGGPKWPKTQSWPHGAVFSAFWTILERSNFGRSCGSTDPPPSGAGHQTPPIWCAAPDPPPLDGHKFDPKVSEAFGTCIVLCFGPKKGDAGLQTPPSGRPQILTPNAVVQTPPLVPHTRPPLCRPAYFTQKSHRLPGPT